LSVLWNPSTTVGKLRGVAVEGISRFLAVTVRAGRGLPSVGLALAALLTPLRSVPVLVSPGEQSSPELTAAMPP